MTKEAVMVEVLSGGTRENFNKHVRILILNNFALQSKTE
jgi:hypothetical protein